LNLVSLEVIKVNGETLIYCESTNEMSILKVSITDINGVAGYLKSNLEKAVSVTSKLFTYSIQLCAALYTRIVVLRLCFPPLLSVHGQGR